MTTKTTAREINQRAYDAIAKEFGEEHAQSVAAWYEGPDVDESEVPELLEGIVTAYGELDN